MEFLKVIFKDKRGRKLNRGVKIGGVQMGKTNVILELEKGTYTISLMPPPDFMPLQYKDIVLKDTNELEPMEVRFDKI